MAAAMFKARAGAGAGASSAGASSSAAAAPQRLVPWVEKYRPRNVDDISAQEDIVRSLKNAVTTRSIPHMLFYGPPGTGKTSTILAMCRDLYGPDLMKTRVMELNASDERGIAVIRDKVKSFAMGSVGSGSAGNGPPFKIIILDEADSLTPDAQAALRRTMETYSRVTRFCIICNYVSRIIEPLASRCSKYRFKPLEPEHMRTRLRHVCDGEAVQASDDTLDAVLKVSGGDMRKAITFLQSASQLHGGALKPENIVEISGSVPETALGPLLKNIHENAGFNAVRGNVTTLLAQGFAMSGVLDKLTDAVVHNDKLPSLSAGQKASIAERIASAEKRLLDGADEELQLLDVAEFMLRTTHKLAVQADRERPPF